MKRRLCGALVVLLLMIVLVKPVFAEGILQYRAGENAALDECLRVAYEQLSEIAHIWTDEAFAAADERDLLDAYTEADIEHPLKIYAFYPSESFDAYHIFEQQDITKDSITESQITWQALWNVNMINETGQSHYSVRWMARWMSLIDTCVIEGFHDTCYIAFQLNETSPCYITVLHQMPDETVLVYTTGIWVNSPEQMNNLQTLEYVLRLKYTIDSFDVYDATQFEAR